MSILTENLKLSALPSHPFSGFSATKGPSQNDSSLQAVEIFSNFHQPLADVSHFATVLFLFCQLTGAVPLSSVCIQINDCSALYSGFLSSQCAVMAFHRLFHRSRTLCRSGFIDQHIKKFFDHPVITAAVSRKISRQSAYVDDFRLFSKHIDLNGVSPISAMISPNVPIIFA